MIMSSVERAIDKGRKSLIQLQQRSRSAAAPAVAKAKITLSFGASRGVTGLRSLYADGLRPAIRSAGQWLALHLRPATLLRQYRKALLFVHRYGPDRKIERLCFVPTAPHTPLAIVRVPHQLRRSGHDYRPTPWHVFHWAMQMISDPVDRYAFVDYGAGRGRVLLMASHYPFEKIVGAEIAEELHRDCLLNIAQYPRSLMKCRDVDCEHLSALRLDVPDQETVFFLNNPFDRSMLERVVTQIVRAYKQEPRRFYVICVDISEPDIFDDTGIFERATVPWLSRIKLAAFSPYEIAVYRTVH